MRRDGTKLDRERQSRASNAVAHSGMRCPARVKSAYQAQGAQDVTLAEGFRVIIVGEENDDWYIIMVHSFLFPRSHLDTSVTGASAVVTQDYHNQGTEDITLPSATRVVVIKEVDGNWVRVAGKHVPNSTKILPKNFLIIDMLEDEHQPNVVEM